MALDKNVLRWFNESTTQFHNMHHSCVFRLTLNNVTNEKYWAGVFAAGSMDGFGTANTRGTQLFLGEPRRIIASMQVTF